MFCCQYPLINYLDAYDVGAVVGLGVGGAAVGVDAAAGVAAVGAADVE